MRFPGARSLIVVTIIALALACSLVIVTGCEMAAPVAVRAS